MFRRLINWLAITKTERNVITFLAGTLIVGAGIRFYQESTTPLDNHDYRAADSSFAAFKEKLASVKIESSAARGELPVNINTASKGELLRIPGIGATLAERILDHRARVRGFGSINELQNVKGISKKKLEKLKPFVSVR
jgi:competence ComEA-like helix-hairpin-helix protein